MTHEPDAYLAARIREALATDDRTCYLDAQVTIAASKVFLMGPVESEERRLAIELVASELVPADMQLVNELSVECYETPALGARVRG